MAGGGAPAVLAIALSDRWGNRRPARAGRRQTRPASTARAGRPAHLRYTQSTATPPPREIRAPMTSSPAPNTPPDTTPSTTPSPAPRTIVDKIWSDQVSAR